MSRREAIMKLSRFFGSEMTPEDVYLYEYGLEHIADAQLVEACNLAIRRCKFMPRPAELIELAEEPTAGYHALPAHPERCHACPQEYDHEGPCRGEPPPREALEALGRLFGKDYVKRFEKEGTDAEIQSEERGEAGDLPS